jgi:hypothetical protein
VYNTPKEVYRMQNIDGLFVKFMLLLTWKITCPAAAPLLTTMLNEYVVVLLPVMENGILE